MSDRPDEAAEGHGPADGDGPDAGATLLVLALEAVLRVEQLTDVRRMVDLRMAHLDEQDRWRTVLVVDELVSWAITDSGHCAGLRILEQSGRLVRVEVDHPGVGGIDGDPEAATGPDRVLDGIGRAWGVDQWSDHTTRGDPQDPDAGLTVWCDIVVPTR